MIEFIAENTTRKIDSLGRIGVPKGIRNRMRLDVNQEMEFYTLRAEDGREFVAFCPVESERNDEEKYIMVADLLTELGIDIPREVLDHI